MDKKGIILASLLVIVKAPDGSLLYPPDQCKKTEYEDVIVLECSVPKPLQPFYSYQNDGLDVTPIYGITIPAETKNNQKGDA
jgi:hypothetical protein